jgi:hypothetical protein
MCFCVRHIGYAQEIPKEKLETKRLMNLFTQLEGSYQIQIIDSREGPVIPLTIMDSIQIKRKQNETTFFWLKKNVRIKILPYNIINKQGFSPLERVKHISSVEE